MKFRILPLLLLALVPGLLHAQTAALRPNDVIELRITGVPPEDSAAFNGTYTIDDQGMINLNYIQKVKVAGLLPNQIQDLIQNRYIEAKYYLHPTVSVQQNAGNRFVNVNGQVRSPNRVAYTADMTLMSAITAAGGPNEFADKKNVKLLRDGKVTTFNTIDIGNGKAEDPKVLPGDQITVKQSVW